MDNNISSDINQYIRQCNGTDELYRHMFGRTHYSSGVKYVAEKAGAYWLIDIVMSHQMNRKAIHAANGFQVWRLKHNKTSSGCKVTMDDGGQFGGEAKILITQRVEFTDFPRDVEIVWYLENGVLMLREER